VHGMRLERQYRPTNLTGHGQPRTRRRVVEHHRSSALSRHPGGNGQLLPTPRANAAARHDDREPDSSLAADADHHVEPGPAPGQELALILCFILTDLVQSWPGG
jgi:hypothetical protein